VKRGRYFLLEPDRLGGKEDREIMRLMRDGARIYPTVAFEAQPSEYIPRLRSEAAEEARSQSAARLIAKRKTNKRAPMPDDT
jgi:hypothetical protein